tara:strand:- start:610 stop:1071 length:462 start_codon:yes stop_codon:yes gene_type:complete
MINDLRNIDENCKYCDKKSGQPCLKECFTVVFRNSLIESPPFKPSKAISNKVGEMFANEIIQYMSFVAEALDELTFIGRMTILSKDYVDLHNFADSLNNADAFESKEDILSFYKDPSNWEGCARMWRELDRPRSSRAEGWDIFKQIVEVNIGK